MPNAEDPALHFLRLFATTYTLLHRRKCAKNVQLTMEGRALLMHLAWSGPLSIGDLAQHADRAQSVISESVSVLESHGMLARVRDPRDRRKTLVWLTDLAREWMSEEQEPLDRARTARALSALTDGQRQRLFEAFDAFIATAQRLRDDDMVSSLAPMCEQAKHK